jgi:hypothetical protein
MGSLALFELEETLGQTGVSVIIQMHEIDQKNCFPLFKVEDRPVEKPFRDMGFGCNVLSALEVRRVRSYHPARKVPGAQETLWIGIFKKAWRKPSSRPACPFY